MRNLLIVGASRGIGLDLAERMAETWNLWTASRHASSSARGNHVTWDAAASPLPTDTLPEKLHGLVYCPGSIRLQPFHRLTDKDFEEDWSINALGAVRAMRATLPALQAAEKASVVFLSTTAVSTGMPMHASVAAAKGALEGLTRSLAAELAPKVRVNAVAPSLTDTPLASRLLRTERQRDAANQRHPMERIGDPADISAALDFLLSEDADWITGQVLHVDGGIGAIRRFT